MAGCDRVRAQDPDTAAFDPFNDGEALARCRARSDEQILDWVARDAETALHPSCTCRMGAGELDVLDPATMAVRGTEGLRVVDASSMPTSPTATSTRPW